MDHMPGALGFQTYIPKTKLNSNQ